MKFVIIILLGFSTAYSDDFHFTERDIADVTAAISETATLALKNVGYDISKAFADVPEDSVTFRFFSNMGNKANGTPLKLKDSNSIRKKARRFDPDLDTVFIVHGWKNNCSKAPMVREIKDALLQSVGDFNVIAVCWEDFSFKFYGTAVAAVPQVGAYLGEFIENLSETLDYPLSKITLIGHSLGAHISGFAGKHLNGSISRIVALDPAAPLYVPMISWARLASSDAKYVEVIHTDGVFLGIYYSLGTVNYFPNGGMTQKGCENDFTRSCSHGRAYYYFAESLRNNRFVSKQCSTYANFLSSLCFSQSMSMMGGWSYNTEVTGNYFLTTNSKPPYGLGEKGINPTVEVLGFNVDLGW